MLCFAFISDIYILCGLLIDRECQKSDFKSVARNLCDEAMLLGSLDNITVQVIDVR